MKKLWATWAERIDNASVRERMFIFGTVALLLIALLQSVLLDPQLSKERRLSTEVSTRQGEIRQLQDQIQKSLRARNEDPDAANRARLQTVKAQLAEGNKLIQEKEAHLVPPERMAALLQEILKRNRRLELVDLKTIPVPDVNPTAEVAEALGEKVQQGLNQVTGNANTAAALALRRVYRHSVEITVRGAYLDLLGYVSALEKLPQKMFWSDLELVAGQYPAVTMTVRVQTLSLDKTWLVL